MSYGTTEDFAWATEMKSTAKPTSPNTLAPPSLLVEDSSTESTSTGNTARSLTEKKGAASTTINDDTDFESNCVHIARNSIEAHRIKNNYKFGMKMWKSDLTSVPLDKRSEDIQQLYSDIENLKDHRVSTLRPSNILYTILFGWWLCLLYGVVGLVMAISIVGRPYASFCWRLAFYFLWPFGKFVSQVKKFPDQYANVQGSTLIADASIEGSSLITVSREGRAPPRSKTMCCIRFWSRPSSWVWIMLGLPPLLIAHCLVFGICWLFVVSIPAAKLNGKMITTVLYLPPKEVEIGDSGTNFEDGNGNKRRIIMYSHQSINVYYYKYSVDGVNIIMANLLVFVVVSITMGFATDISAFAKALLGFLAIIPLTYYIGMAIASISAQSTFAVGAFMNATFGSAVEVILCVLILKKGVEEKDDTYQEVVKSALAGAFYMGILFIPGMSMVIGGLKFRSQKFNPRSANITATFLFLTVVGVFAPTIFFKIYGSMKCQGCAITGNPLHDGGFSNDTSFICTLCHHSMTDHDGSNYLYNNHIRPLVYAVCIVLPLSYTIGIIFTLKSHSQMIFEDFERELKEEIVGDEAIQEAHWSRLKCAVILFMCAVATALCGELISDNLQPLLETTGMSEYFVGVSLLALMAGLPECVNGIQFALQNNVNLGIEVGCATAIQVGMVQIPALVLTNLIYNLNFNLLFNDVHLWAVMFAVIVINYIFQDGKSDYFQGTAVISLHFLLMLMYFFMLSPEQTKNHGDGHHITTTTAP